MSGDRIQRGAASPVPPRPSPLLRSADHQQQPQADPADELQEALAATCFIGGAAKPAGGYQQQLPTQQPTSSRNSAPQPGPAGPPIPLPQQPEGPYAARHSAPLMPSGRSQNDGDGMSGQGENHLTPSTAAGAASAASPTLRARSGSGSSRSNASGSGLAFRPSPLDASSDDGAGAIAGPNRSPLFLPSFENLEVPGADSTHKLSCSSTCALRCGQSIPLPNLTKESNDDITGTLSTPQSPSKSSCQNNLPSPSVFSLTPYGGLSSFQGSFLSLSTAPPPEHNWQASKCSVRERNAVLLNSEFMADVYFLIGQENKIRIPAHKYVLAIGSSVFYAMFFGGLASNSEEIEIPDVEPVAFMVLLKYLYCDEIDLEADTVLAVLYAAKKYIVPHLARSCVRFLETSLSAKNACVLLSQSRLFEEPELMQRCWEVIDAQAEEALTSDGFADIDFDTLKTVLSRETLNAQEKVIFESACRWAEAECGREEMEATPENQRKILGEALLLLRIPAMSLEEFANGAAQSGILTLEETNEIFLYYTAQKKPSLNFPIVKRKGLMPQCCHRFQSSAYRSNQWRYRGRCDAIQFAVDKRIFIAGFGLYGSSSGAAEYMVRIELKRNGTIVGERETNFKSDGSSSTFPVWFCNPIQIEPEVYYTACVILAGDELSYFGQEGMSEVAVSRVTFQFQCSSDSTNGTGVQGGQIPELIFYA